MSTEVNELKSQVSKLRIEVNQLMKERNILLRIIEKSLKQAHIAAEVSQMIKEWLDADYESSEEEDRLKFAYKLTKFISEKFE